MPVDIDKVRAIVGKLKEEAKSDPALLSRANGNIPRILAERGLTLDEVIEAHDLGDCPYWTMSGLAHPGSQP
jgi:hypothetical protein